MRSCCGQQRQEFRGTPPAARPPAITSPTHPTHQPSARHAYVFFEYTGNTGLTVVGPVSGQRYRFDAPGARQAVHPADKPSLAAVPNLRRVLGP